MQKQNFDENRGSRIIGDHRLIGSKLSHQSGRSHTGAGRIVLHVCRHRSDGSEDSAGKNRREPDLRMTHNVRHLEHGSAESLGDQPAEAVFTVACDCKADHIAAAADGSRSGSQA